MNNRGFFKKLEEKCNEYGVSYNEIEKYLINIIGNETVHIFYITKGDDPNNKNVLIDMMVFTDRFYIGFSYDNNEAINMIKFHRKDIKHVSLGKERNLLKVIITEDPLTALGWNLFVPLNEKNKLTQFVLDVFKSWEK